MHIYLIRNTINGKLYVGLDSSEETNPSRWKVHLSTARSERQYGYTMVLHRAMKKYGSENFTYEVLEECSQEKLAEREKHWIACLESTNPQKGYNRTEGGEQNYWSNLSDKEKALHAEQRSKRMKQAITPEWLERMKAGKSKLPKKVLAANYQRSGAAAAKKLAKTYDFVSPCGQEMRATNMRRFCREHGLTPSNMREVINGKSNHHKGWKCFVVVDGKRIMPPRIPRCKFPFK